MKNKLDEYLKGDDFVGLDKVLLGQRLIDGYVAVRLGITSLGPIGCIVGFAAGFFLCSFVHS